MQHHSQPVSFRHVDFTNTLDIDEFSMLLQSYASDPMGGEEAISQQILEKLPKQALKHPQFKSLLLSVEKRAVGIANYIISFSTFYAAPVLNIHDFYIETSFRGRGFSQLLMSELEHEARKLQCCKMTLEVLEANSVAKSAYEKFGFARYQLSDEAGYAEFWQKIIK